MQTIRQSVQLESEGTVLGSATTFRGLPAPPQLLHSDVLVFSVQVAVLVGLLLLHVFYDKLQR